ncbi:glycine zipper 2TM domain-containing protein [[Pseudomonas] boreopolis]
MKTLMLGVLTTGLLVAGSASAQRYDGRYDGGVYDYARVVRVDPIIVSDYAERSEPRCYERPADGYVDRGGGYYDGYGGGYASPGNRSGRSLATVVGGVAGAVLGSRVGGGSGRLVGTAIGTMVGGVAGRSIYDANHPGYAQGSVRVCDPVTYRDERERVDGYDVTYEYAGRTYHTRSDYNPGDRIRVRVDVVPQ